MLVFKAQTSAIQALRFSPDGRFVAVGGPKDPCRVYELAALSVAGGTKKPKPVYAHDRPACASIAFSPDSRWMAILAAGTRLVDVQTWREVWSDEVGFLSELAFAATAPKPTLFGFGAEMLRWETEPKTGIGTKLACGWGGTRMSNDNKAFPTGPLRPSPDGSTVAAAFAVRGPRAYDPVIRLYDARSGELRAELPREFKSAGPTTAAFSPDGRRFAVNYGAAIAVFDVATRSEIAALSIGTKHVNDLAFTTDGKRLVAVSNDLSARQWDTATWTEVRAVDWEIGRLLRVDVSTDGCLLAAGSHLGKVAIWDAV